MPWLIAGPLTGLLVIAIIGGVRGEQAQRRRKHDTTPSDTPDED